ncbi:MAG: hypothetical protein AB1698_03280 [Pseudomonadota bacterium]
MPLDAITLSLLTVAFCAGGLLTIVCLDPVHQIDRRRAYLDGWRRGHRDGRQSLFPHRKGGE